MSRKLPFAIAGALLSLANVAAAQVLDVDRDGDGVVDSMEARAPDAGDGNFDGVLDAAQSNVSTLDYLSKSTALKGSGKQGTITNLCPCDWDSAKAAAPKGFANVAFVDWSFWQVAPSSPIAPLRFDTYGARALVRLDYHRESFPDDVAFAWLVQGARGNHVIEVQDSVSRVGSTFILTIHDNGPQDQDRRTGAIRVVGFPRY